MTMPVTPKPTPKPAPAPTPVPQVQPAKCLVSVQPDGAMAVSFLIEPDVAKRFMSRFMGMDPATYMYENVIHRAIIGHVF